MDGEVIVNGIWCCGRCGCSVIFVRVNRVCQVSSSIMIVVVAFVIFVTKCKRLKMKKIVMICIQKKANAQLQKGGVHSQQPLKFSITSFALISKTSKASLVLL